MEGSRTAPARMGDKAGKPRLYLSGKYLLDYGWRPGQRFSVEYTAGCIAMWLDVLGNRTVSGKRGGSVAVLDVNSPELAQAFGNPRAVTVIVTVGRIDVMA